jgi:hypothetical protein
MRTVIILMLALAPLLLRGERGTVSTNVDGMVLELVFYDTTIEAGQFVNAVMVVSNASPEPAYYSYHPGGDIRDTGIGDYIVTDASGRVLPKVVWGLPRRSPPLYHEPMLGHKGETLRPGHIVEYPGNIVKRYCLTNPGLYQVRAIAEVPARRSRALQSQGEMTIETPPITVEVVPRRGQELEPIFTPEELAEIPKLAEIVAAYPPLRVTHSASVNAAQTPAPAPKPKDDEQAAAPAKTPEVVEDNSIIATAPAPEIAADTTAPRSRGVVYGLIALALVLGLGVFLLMRRKAAPLPK